jgi:aspartate 1-decarboxylase
MRLRQLLSAKIHRATVTDANVNYVGSVTIDQDLMDRVGMLPGELVHVWNGDNGERIETYTISGERGSRIIQINGPAALRFRIGHKIIIASFLLTDEPETVKPRIALVDDENRFTGYA